MKISINKVSVVTSYSANEKVADVVVSGGASPYSYSLVTGGDYFQLNGTEVHVKANMDISNIQSFSVKVTDSSSGSAISDVVYPNIEAKIQNRFESSNHIYVITNDVDLGHGVLTIPSGCILDFQGGKITNGVLLLNGTKVLPNGLSVGSYITADISGKYVLGQLRWNDNFNVLEFWNGEKWEFIGSSHTLYEYQFDYYKALNSLFYKEVYLNKDLYIGIVGLQKDANHADSISHFSTPSPKFSLSPGQTVYFDKENGGRLNVLFYNSENVRIALPDDIGFSETFYKYEASGYTTFLQSTNDNISYGNIINHSEDTTYLFSVATTKNYRLQSDKSIVLKKITNRIKFSGSTSERPSLGSWVSGLEYYDSTLKKMILWNGSDWVNIDGSTL